MAQEKGIKVHYGMVIDLLRCIGCGACTIACKQENKTPPGLNYHTVLEEELGTYPNVKRQLFPRPCQHCEHPACMEVCPVNAIYKRADGIVVIDYGKCIGSKNCIDACPYEVPKFDDGENYRTVPGQYDAIAAFEFYGKYGLRKKGQTPIGKTRKCHFCLHRIEKGLEPACVVTCMGRARSFGDFNNPNSKVSQLLKTRKAIRLKEELETEPSVYYLV